MGQENNLERPQNEPPAQIRLTNTFYAAITT